MLCMLQTWTHSKGMQEKIVDTISKGENIITLKDMEEEGSTARKMWHSRVHRHDRFRGSWKCGTSVFQISYAGFMKTSRVYTRVTGCRVAYMEIRRNSNRTDPGNGSVMKWLAQAQGEHILQIMHCWHYG